MTSLHQTLPESLLGHYAGFVTRLVAFIIDAFIISATIVFVSWFVNATIDMLLGQALLTSLVNAFPLLQSFTEFATHPLTHSLVSLAFIFTYYLFFWTLIGQTPGKYLMGIRIVTVQGHRLNLSRALLRYLGYYLSGVCLGLGFLWILVDDDRRSWHDRLSGTCVIYVWNARPDERFLVRLSDELRLRGATWRDRFRRPQQ